MKFIDYYEQLGTFSDKVRKGTHFEKSIISYLEQIDSYDMKKVVRWNDWEGKDQTGDVGVDLVGETNNGEWIAVQCKFYDKDEDLPLGNLDNFFNLLGIWNHEGKTFSKGMIVTTAKGLSDNVQKLIDQANHLKKPCSAITYNDLDREGIEWGEKVKIKSDKTLLPHQKEAIEKVKEGFYKQAKANDRGQLIMACGTGKTFTSLRLIEELGANRVLFLVPSISLISQVSTEYSIERKREQRHLLVCSDTSLKTEDDSPSRDNNIPSTTDPVKIKTFLEETEPSIDKKQIVFSTYQSLEQIQTAFIANGHLKPFDLVLCDEAHNIAGKTDTLFSTVIGENFKPYYKKILFMTATPRIYTDIAKKKAKIKEIDLRGMDDVHTYGREFFNYRFKTAIEEDRLCNYEVLVLKVNASIDIPIENKGFFELYEHLNDRNVIEQLEKTFKKYRLNKVISFSNNIKNSKSLINKFPKIDVKHVDGKISGHRRKEIIQNWFKKDDGNKPYKILTNARCLTEGVDVPAVNGVMFLNPKKSTVDIIQAIGRAIRKSPQKDKGYIIIPVIIPKDKNDEETLGDSQYEAILNVLLALRSYNDEEDLKTLLTQNLRFVEYDGHNEPREIDKQALEKNNDQLYFWENKLYSKVVELESSIRKSYLQGWFRQVAKLKEAIKTSFEASKNHPEIKPIMEGLLGELENTINKDIALDDLKDLFCQHLLTGHVLDKVFEHFYRTNPVAKGFCQLEQKFLSLPDNQSLQSNINRNKEYMRNIVMKDDSFRDKHTFLINLYEGFYKAYDPKMASKNGIVYTPREIVNFIISGSDLLLQKHFGKKLIDEEVEILDPCTGTGNFINATLDYLFKKYRTKSTNLKKIKKLYAENLHANEISLLAYYIASIAIESKYQEHTQEPKTFEGIVYQDTLDNTDFSGSKDSQMVAEGFLKENTERQSRQNRKKMTVIIGNPPYRANQGNENENNKNKIYRWIDGRIQHTYSQASQAQKTKYTDMYVRFIRWCTERINGQGIIGFVVNSGFIDSNSFDGFRKTVEKEFDAIYIVDLKGNLRKREKHNVFDIQTGVCVVFFIKYNKTKNIKNDPKSDIHYKAIDDLLSEKKIDDSKNHRLDFLDKYFFNQIHFNSLNPKNGYWLDTEATDFDTLIPVVKKANKKADKTQNSIFSLHSNGVVTSRDHWVYDLDGETLKQKIKYFINTYNEDVKRWQASDKSTPIKDFVNRDIKHTSETENYIKKTKSIIFHKDHISDCMFRPFVKNKTYFGDIITHRKYQIPKLFGPNLSQKNICIVFVGNSERSVFKDNVFITDKIYDFGLFTEACKGIPLYTYPDAMDIAAGESAERQDNITDWALDLFRGHYGDKKISKTDIFYYVYAVFNHEGYLKKYQTDLKRKLPRIPFYKDFKKMSELGKKLATLHIDYEQAKKDDRVCLEEDTSLDGEYSPIMKIEAEQGRVILDDKTQITKIPPKAFDLVYSGKSPIKWVVDRHKIKNPSQKEQANYKMVFEKFNTKENEVKRYREISRKYLMDLIPRLVTVSLETIRIKEEIGGME